MQGPSWESSHAPATLQAAKQGNAQLVRLAFMNSAKVCACVCVYHPTERQPRNVFLKYGASVNLQRKDDGRTALFEACLFVPRVYLMVWLFWCVRECGCAGGGLLLLLLGVGAGVVLVLVCVCLVLVRVRVLVLVVVLLLLLAVVVVLVMLMLMLLLLSLLLLLVVVVVEAHTGYPYLNWLPHPPPPKPKSLNPKP